MSLSLLHALLDWISQHSLWAGAIIFLIACAESLALVGLAMPGAVLMFGIGTLISTGHIPFWTAVTWAALGAIAGDGISYWLGYYYRGELARLWPLSRHPELIAKGRRFFDRHGGKSVLFGRFFGPLRPIIPAIAGMAEMPLPRFIAINVLSGIAWAPLYLLPGMAFGLSLTIAGEVAGRLVAAILLLLGSTLALLWLGRRAYQVLLPRMDRMLMGIARWGRQHPVAGRIPTDLISPEHPEVRALSLLALLLFVASGLFVGLLQTGGIDSPLHQLDRVLYSNMQALHTPGFHRLMHGILAWTSTQAILSLGLISALWLIWQRNLLALWHLLAALGLPWLMGHGLSLIFSPTPSSALPSPPLMTMVAITGFMAVVLARELVNRYRLMVYLLALLLIFLSSIARLYLQLNSFTELSGSIALGVVWLTLLGIGYRRHVHQAYVSRPALVVIALGLCLGLVLNSLGPSVKAPPPMPPSPVAMTWSHWQQDGWREHALLRKDIRYLRNHPLNLQWAGELSAIRRHLLNSGWQTPPPANGLGLLQWFNPKATIETLPLLPQVHDGRYDVLRLVRYDDSGARFLRLWRAEANIRQGGREAPLWLGATGRLYRQSLLGVSLLRTSTDYTALAAQLKDDLTHTPVTVHSHNIALYGQATGLLLIGGPY